MGVKIRERKGTQVGMFESISRSSTWRWWVGTVNNLA